MSNTPTPWKVHEDGDNAPFITGAASDVHRVCDLYNWEYMNRPGEAKDNAVHIVRCVNAHEKLVEALEAGLEAMEFIVYDRMPMGEGDDYSRTEIFTNGANYMNGLETTFVVKAEAALAAAKGG